MVRGLNKPEASLIPKEQLSIASAYTSQLFSRISLSQFYGIELDNFAHEIAILSLWLAEHQMNVRFNETFQQKTPSLPLKQGGKIVCGNATRLDWAIVCPKDGKCEVYILGNPPYLGSSLQNAEQKEDLVVSCKGLKNYKNLDYIACWFIKGAEYIRGISAKFAFVSTNSICQGEQVVLLWPHVLSIGLEIFFAHQSFKWSNNAKRNAGVTCIIVGLRHISSEDKVLFKDSVAYHIKNITPYLSSCANIVLSGRTTPISILPAMLYGNKPVDNGHLILSKEERKYIIDQYPSATEFILPLSGSQEFIRGLDRYCIWVDEYTYEKASEIPPLNQRFDLVKESRLQSSKIQTRKYAKKPYRFVELRYKSTNAIIVPSVSSERREYIPIGFLDAKTIISNSAFAIYDAEPYIFGIISSKIHTVWVKATSGKLEDRIRYSAVLSYNTFPIPPLSEKQKETIAMHARNVITEREKHPEKTMAQLYDPDKMPKGLREAHDGLDQAVERCYRSKPFSSDEERLECLFKLYETMIEAGKANEVM